MENILIDERETCSCRHVVSLSKDKKTINIKFELSVNLKENRNSKKTYGYNRKKRAEITVMHNEKNEPRDYNTHNNE